MKMQNIFFYICIFLTIYATGQTFTRVLPLPSTSEQFEMGTCAPIVRTSDGGYILNYSYGYSGLHGGNTYSEIIKTDSVFIPQWRKELNGENGKKTFSFNDGSSIIYTQGNGLALEKINNAGNTLWLKKYKRMYPLSLQVNDAIYNSAKIKLAGCVMKYNGFGYWVYSSALLLDVDTSGNFIRADSLVISSFANSGIYNITNDTFGNYYIMGSGIASGGNSFIAKISSTNTVLWCKQLNSSNSAHSYSASAILDNGDLLVGGSMYNSNVGTSAIILLRLTNSGGLVWSKTIGYPSSVSSVQQLLNGNILVTGCQSATYRDTLKNIIIKLDPNGNSLWTKRYDAGFAMSQAYQKTNNDWYFSAFTKAPILFNTDNLGRTSCPSSNFTIAFNDLPVTITPITCVFNPISIPNVASTTNPISTQLYVDSCSFFPTSISKFSYSYNTVVYPNPINDQFFIDANTPDKLNVDLYDVNGRHVFSASVSNKENINVATLENGAYMLTIKTANRVINKKLVILR